MANGNNCNYLPRPELIIPTSFGECLTYAQQIAWLAKQIETLAGTVASLEARVEALENEEET